MKKTILLLAVLILLATSVQSLSLKFPSPSNYTYYTGANATQDLDNQSIIRTYSTKNVLTNDTTIRQNNVLTSGLFDFGGSNFFDFTNADASHTCGQPDSSGDVTCSLIDITLSQISDWAATIANYATISFVNTKITDLNDTTRTYIGQVNTSVRADLNLKQYENSAFKTLNWTSRITGNCSGTDKVFGIYGNGSIVCQADQTGAGGGNFIYNNANITEYLGGTGSNDSLIRAGNMSGWVRGTDAFNLGNATVFTRVTDGYNKNNQTTKETPYYSLSNFTGNYDARTDRFGNSNFSFLNVGAFNLANYSVEYSSTGFRVLNWTSLYNNEALTRFTLGNYSTEYGLTGWKQSNLTSNSFFNSFFNVGNNLSNLIGGNCSSGQVTWGFYHNGSRVCVTDQQGGGGGSFSWDNENISKAFGNTTFAIFNASVIRNTNYTWWQTLLGDALPSCSGGSNALQSDGTTFSCGSIVGGSGLANGSGVVNFSRILVDSLKQVPIGSFGVQNISPVAVNVNGELVSAYSRGRPYIEDNYDVKIRQSFCGDAIADFNNMAVSGTPTIVTTGIFNPQRPQCAAQLPTAATTNACALISFGGVSASTVVANYGTNLSLGAVLDFSFKPNYNAGSNLSGMRVYGFWGSATTLRTDTVNVGCWLQCNGTTGLTGGNGGDGRSASGRNPPTMEAKCQRGSGLTFKTKNLSVNQIGYDVLCNANLTRGIIKTDSLGAYFYVGGWNETMRNVSQIMWSEIGGAPGLIPIRGGAVCNTNQLVITTDSVTNWFVGTNEQRSLST